SKEHPLPKGFAIGKTGRGIVGAEDANTRAPLAQKPSTSSVRIPHWIGVGCPPVACSAEGGRGRSNQWRHRDAGGDFLNRFQRIWMNTMISVFQDGGNQRSKRALKSWITSDFHMAIKHTFSCMHSRNFSTNRDPNRLRNCCWEELLELLTPLPLQSASARAAVVAIIPAVATIVFLILLLKRHFNASQWKKMLTWVKDKEVFLKKYSFTTICMWGHWSLVILCHEEEDDVSFIMLLDSLHSIDPTKLDIYATKKKAVIADAMSSIDISIPSVPQQTNGTECGFFVLYYIYHFIQNDPLTFSLDDYPSFLTCDWFSRAEFEKFVDDLILRKIEVQEVVVEINELGQPVGEGGHSLKLFLGTIARLGDKMSIDAPTWRPMSATHKDDVWEYVQRKYDIPAYLKEWVMKDLDQKWRSWKYELRNKYFDLTLKQNEQKIPHDPRVNVEQWKRVVQTWSSNSWKRYSDINKKSKSHHKYFHCAGTKSFADINEEETKLQEVKITQPSSSSSSSIATADDIYSQVFGKERPGRVRGVGTSPTPTSLWGTSSQCQAQLRAENAQLVVIELAERLGKVESIVVEVELDDT
ncbi:hypothetical protein Taro_038312, partial [Colocasia esculenta]|nr:hypothetical protein [Colocasia esculenta]